MKRTLSLTPILNVFQLMIALPLDWLTVTAGPPWPWIVAVPPTTVPPAGPPAAGAAPSARSAAVVSRRLRKRGCMAPAPLQPSAQDEEEPRIFPWASLEQARQGGCADQALALRDLRHGQISGYRIEPSQA